MLLRLELWRKKHLKYTYSTPIYDATEVAAILIVLINNEKQMSGVK